MASLLRRRLTFTAQSPINVMPEAKHSAKRFVAADTHLQVMWEPKARNDTK